MLMFDEITNEFLTLRIVLIRRVRHPCTVSNQLLCVRSDGDEFS